MSMNTETHRSVELLQHRSLIAAGVGIALCLIGAILNLQQFFASYLFGYIFWLSIALGSLTILLLHHLVQGVWGVVILRVCEAAASTIPLLALLFVPILLGVESLYPWAHPETMTDAHLEHKLIYLNTTATILRAAGYFVSWWLLMHFATQWSLRRDEIDSPDLTMRLRRLGAGGLVLVGLTATFASIDWIKSLEPLWFSTIYGGIFLVGNVLVAMAFSIAILNVVSDDTRLAHFLIPRVLNDLGSLLFAFVLLFAYFVYSQFLIIWSGNLPDEATWYVSRMEGGWQWVAVLFTLFLFVVPFFLLLLRDIKQDIAKLTTVCGLILLMYLVYTHWSIAPAFSPGRLRVHWLDVVTPVTLGGVWLYMFAKHLTKFPFLPSHDPATLPSHHAAAEEAPHV